MKTAKAPITSRTESQTQFQWSQQTLFWWNRCSTMGKYHGYIYMHDHTRLYVTFLALHDIFFITWFSFIQFLFQNAWSQSLAGSTACGWCHLSVHWDWPTFGPGWTRHWRPYLSGKRTWDSGTQGYFFGEGFVGGATGKWREEAHSWELCFIDGGYRTGQYKCTKTYVTKPHTVILYHTSHTISYKLSMFCSKMM